MNLGKIALAVAAAALTAPAALATAASGASATPKDALPPLPCSVTDIENLECTLNFQAVQVHTATFTGTYHARTGSTNDTNQTVAGVQGTCVDGSSAAGDRVCRVTFVGGDPKKLCTSAATTWRTATPPNNVWVYTPDQSQSGVVIVGQQLVAEGGGVVDDTETFNDPRTGTIGAYRIHIQIESVCGNEDTEQGLADDLAARTGLPSLDLSPTYKFEGYVDVLG